MDLGSIPTNHSQSINSHSTNIKSITWNLLFRLESVLAALWVVRAPMEVNLSQKERRTEAAIFNVGHSVLRVIFGQTQQRYQTINR